jgi:hypothetical protein
MPGEMAKLIEPDQPCLIRPGTRVTLGEVISFAFEAPSA